VETTKVEQYCLECEQKYRVKSVQQILDRAKELKIEFGCPILEKDIYFDRLHAPVLAITDEVLRLRSSGSWYDPTELPPIPVRGKTGVLPYTHILTYKGKKINDLQGVKVRAEVNLVVGDPLACCTVLQHLGYAPTLSFEKVRRLARCAVNTLKANPDKNDFAMDMATRFYVPVNQINCIVCLDFLDADNHFLEIEALVQIDKVAVATQAIEYVAKMFHAEEKELRSYPQIIVDIKGRSDLIT
jgi:adenylate cyclase class IV